MSPTTRAVPVSWRRCGLVALAFWLALCPLAYSPRHSGNVWSRYMTIESLVERGTLAVERSPLRPISGSPDLIKAGDHLYSDKPPLLAVLAAGIYGPLYLLGLRFSGSATQFVIVNWIMVMAVSGLGSALAVLGIRKLLQSTPLPPLVADILALASGFGSQLLTYGVTFNNHSVAAGLITTAFAIVVSEDHVKKPGIGRFLAGLLAGIAAGVDLPAGGAILAILGSWLVLRSRAFPWSFLAGCVGPLIAAAALQTLETGSPLPAEMTPALFDFKGSYWESEIGRFKETGPRARFGLELVVGPQGWLTVTPVLWLGIVGLCVIALKKVDPLRPLALAIGTLVGILLIYYTWGVRRTDFSGLSFGTRHLLAVSPLVFAFAMISTSRMGRALPWAVFLVVWAVGTVYSIAGMKDPWTRIERRDDMGLAVVKRGTLYPWSSYRR